MASPVAAPGTTHTVSGDRRILVADRAQLSRTATAAILQRLGFTVVDAPSARSALARASRGPYACAILDLNLSESGIFELTRRLLAEEGWRWTPVIFTSSRQPPLELRVRMQSAGFAYLPKPFRSDQLLAAVGDALASGGQLRKARPNRELALDGAELAAG